MTEMKRQTESPDDPLNTEELSRLPLVDWRRLAIAVVPSAAVLSFSFFFIVETDAEFLPFGLLWLGTALVALGTISYWLGEASEARGILGSVIFGAAIGIAVLYPITLAETADISLGDLPIFLFLYLGFPMLVSTIEGAVGFRRRKAEPSELRLLSRAPPVVVERVFLGAAVVSLLLLAWMVLYAGLNAFSIVTVPTLLFAAALRLYPKYRSRLGTDAGEVVALALGTWSVVIAASAVVIAIYSGINFPKEGDFEEQLLLEFGPLAEQEAWLQIRPPSFARTFTQDQAEDVARVLEAGPVSMPREASIITGPAPPFFLLSDLVASETKEVGFLVRDGQWDEARTRYARLWTIAYNLVRAEGPMGFGQYLVAVDLGHVLTDFYLKEANSSRLNRGRSLLETVAAFSSTLRGAYESGVTVQYVYSRDFIMQPEELCKDATGLDYEYLGVCIFRLPWPFYDTNKTIRELHDVLLDRVRLTMPPRRAGEPVPESYRRPEVSIWKNHVGSKLLNDLAQFESFTIKDDELRSKLAILTWVIDGRHSGDFDDPPVDPLTGEPFTVTDKGGSVEIRSSYATMDGPLTYEVSKASE